MIREVSCSAGKCKAPMVFVKTTNREGKERTMPLDAKPSQDGRWFINENEGDGSRNDPHTARYVAANDPDYGKYRTQNLLHTPHHATCSEAAQFRKKGK